ncbi:MAG: ACT domain-containing protein, partial [Acidimicrobiia bacterium]
DELLGPGVIVQWETLDDARLRCAVGAPDRPGLLAGVAGALAIEGFDILSADGQTLPNGRAAEVFVGTDRFDRLGDAAGRNRAALTIQGVLSGHISAADAIQARQSTYGQPAVATADERVRVRVAQDESDDATVVEVYAPDEIGLLATIASVFTEQALDVRVARVATTGEQAVDVFYVQEAGEKVTDPVRVERLRRALFDSLRRD